MTQNSATKREDATRPLKRLNLFCKLSIYIFYFELFGIQPIVVRLFFSTNSGETPSKPIISEQVPSSNWKHADDARLNVLSRRVQKR